MKTPTLHSSACSNCGFEQTDKFCANCGQKQKTDYTLTSIFRDIGEVIWGTDSRMGQTFRDYLMPGVYLTNWLQGKQARYISPVKMFLLLNFLYFLILSFGGFNTFVNNFHSHTNNQSYSESITETVMTGISASGFTEKEFIEEFDSRVFNISNTLIIIMTLLYSVQFALLNLRKKAVFYKHVITGFYFSGYLLIVLIILNTSFIITESIFDRTLAIWEGEVFGSTTIVSLLTVVAYFIQRKSYNDSHIIAATKGILLSIPLTYITVIIYRYFLFWITYYSVLW